LSEVLNAKNVRDSCLPIRLATYQGTETISKPKTRLHKTKKTFEITYILTAFCAEFQAQLSFYFNKVKYIWGKVHGYFSK